MPFEIIKRQNGIRYGAGAVSVSMAWRQQHSCTSFSAVFGISKMLTLQLGWAVEERVIVGVGNGPDLGRVTFTPGTGIHAYSTRNKEGASSVAVPITSLVAEKHVAEPIRFERDGRNLLAFLPDWAVEAMEIKRGRDGALAAQRLAASRVAQTVSHRAAHPSVAVRVADPAAARRVG